MNKNIVVVDVQPFYHRWHKNLTPQLVKYLNTTEYDNILYFFNGEDLGIPDNTGTLSEYLIEWGLKEDKLDEFYFIEKDYSFFRGWMDVGVDVNFIVHVVKYMIKMEEYDSRYIDPVDLQYLLEKFYNRPKNELADIWEKINREMIVISNWDYSKLQEFDHYDLCGGGRDECLKEIEILMRALGLHYTILKNLTY